MCEIKKTRKMTRCKIIRKIEQTIHLLLLKDLPSVPKSISDNCVKAESELVTCSDNGGAAGVEVDTSFSVFSSEFSAPRVRIKFFKCHIL